MNARIRVLLTAALVGAAVGTAYPLIDLALACRAPVSEACVWGKSYLALSLGISIPLIGGAVAVVAYAFMTGETEEGMEQVMTSNKALQRQDSRWPPCAGHGFT